jgi:hypothetical protein
MNGLTPVRANFSFDIVPGYVDFVQSSHLFRQCRVRLGPGFWLYQSVLNTLIFIGACPRSGSCE